MKPQAIQEGSRHVVHRQWSVNQLSLLTTAHPSAQTPQRSDTATPSADVFGYRLPLLSSAVIPSLLEVLDVCEGSMSRRAGRVTSARSFGTLTAGYSLGYRCCHTLFSVRQ